MDCWCFGCFLFFFGWLVGTGCGTALKTMFLVLHRSAAVWGIVGALIGQSIAGVSILGLPG
jgi:hypothetical protein